MNSEQKSIILALITGIGIGLALGTGIAEVRHKPPVSIQLDTPKQCTLKIGNTIIQGDLYEQ